MKVVVEHSRKIQLPLSFHPKLHYKTTRIPMSSQEYIPFWWDDKAQISFEAPKKGFKHQPLLSPYLTLKMILSITFQGRHVWSLVFYFKMEKISLSTSLIT